jgi:hypothetical protein
MNAVRQIMLSTSNKIIRQNARRLLVGTPRCGVPARSVAGGRDHPEVQFASNVAPLNAARTAQRAVPTTVGDDRRP